MFTELLVIVFLITKIRKTTKYFLVTNLKSTSSLYVSCLATFSSLLKTNKRKMSLLVVGLSVLLLAGNRNCRVCFIRCDSLLRMFLSYLENVIRYVTIHCFYGISVMETENCNNSAWWKNDDCDIKWYQMRINKVSV